MRVLLVVPSLDVPRFKGLAKVSLELVKGLAKAVDLEVLEVHKSRNNHLKNLTIIPFREVTSKAEICHAVVPESGAIAFLKRRRMVTTFHDLMPLRLAERLDFKNEYLLKAYITLMWSLASRAEVVLCNSSQTAVEVKDIFKCNAIVINPGVDERFKPLHTKTEKLTLGFFANFSHRKRVNIAVEVFKILKRKINCRLILAGGDVHSLYQGNFNVKKMVEGLSDVKIWGYVPEDNVVNLYNSFDFFVFPSIFEGFGIPILEAEKCGVPTFIMRDAMIPQEARRSAIKCKSPEDMAGKILYLLHNRDEYRRVSEEGQSYASKFTWGRFIKQHLAIYETLAR